MSADLYVIGTRSFAAEVLDIAEAAGFTVAGLLEPYDATRIGTTIHERPVLALDDVVPGTVVVGTGERSRREIVARAERAGWRFATVVHPSAEISSRSSVGAGAVVAPGVVVGAFARVGEHAVVGRGALIGHHSIVGPFATINPGANVAGNVHVGEDAFVGMGAVVRDHLTIGPSSTVAMGAVVVRDVAAGTAVRGIPAEPYTTERGDV